MALRPLRDRATQLGLALPPPPTPPPGAAKPVLLQLGAAAGKSVFVAMRTVPAAVDHVAPTALAQVHTHVYAHPRVCTPNRAPSLV